MLLPHTDIAAPDAAPTRTAFVLHGILGSARNWLSFLKKLAPRAPGWRFVAVDLRNHGEAHGLAGPHTLSACADDLHDLAQHLKTAPEAVIGHSFGGKVALEYARLHAAGPLRQCWVLDASPGPRRPEETEGDTHEVVSVVEALRTIPLPVPSRAELQETLRARGFGEMFAGWMTTNLRPLDGGGFAWRFDLDAVEEMLASYFAADLWPFVTQPPPGLTIHLLRGERSDRWRPSDLARLQDAQLSGRVRMHVLPAAGHWVHVDNPDGLMDLLAAGLADAGV